MGWLFYSKPDNVKQHLDELCAIENEAISQKVLDSAIVNIRTYYAAAERIDKATGEREVFAFIFLLDYRGPDQVYNFGYKDMDEGMGPYESECPERILDLLTEPPMNEHAKAWRERCWQTITTRKARPRITAGKWLVFRRPVMFGDNRYRQAFYITSGKRRKFRDAHHTPVTLKGLRTYLPEYKVVDEPTEEEKKIRYSLD